MSLEKSRDLGLGVWIYKNITCDRCGKKLNAEYTITQLKDRNWNVGEELICSDCGTMEVELVSEKPPVGPMEPETITIPEVPGATFKDCTGVFSVDGVKIDAATGKKVEETNE